MSNNIILGWRRGIILFATFLFLIWVGLGTTGCKKKDNLLGSEALDPTSILLSGGVDTFKLTTYTIEDNEVITSAARYGILGILNDRDFGTVDAGIYTQVRLSGLNPNFGDPSLITIDSFVIALQYVGAYGYTGYQTFEVYELDEQMHADTNYLATQDLALKSENWVDGTGSYKLDPDGITVVGADTVRTQLRIKLNPAKALQLIQDRTNNPADFASNTTFTSNYLKGINIKTNGVAPGEQQGMVAYFDLASQDSKIIIYYKENGEVRPQFDLVFNTETVDYNRYKIDNTGTQVAAVIADSTLGNDEFYVQSGKNRAIIDFPTVQYLPENIVVHNAKLFLPIQQIAGQKFSAPTSIYLTHPNILAPIAGTYDPNLKGYVADVRAVIQNFKIGNLPNTTLTINTPNFIAAADRIIFNGQQTNNKVKPRLIISYTEF